MRPMPGEGRFGIMIDENSFKRVTFKAHSTLFEEGDAGDTAYLLSGGLVVIIRGRDRIKLATLGAGDIVGEMALLDDRPRMATALAVKDTEAWEIPREAFNARLATLDPVMRQLFAIFLIRIRNMTDEFMRKKGTADWIC